MPNLVLARKEGESIIIDGGITITVVKIHESKVRLSVEAPLEIKILRNEHLEGDNEKKGEA